VFGWLASRPSPAASPGARKVDSVCDATTLKPAVTSEEVA